MWSEIKRSFILIRVAVQFLINPIIRQTTIEMKAKKVLRRYETEFIDLNRRYITVNIRHIVFAKSKMKTMIIFPVFGWIQIMTL